MGESRTALGDLFCRQFKERRFKCEIKTAAGEDPWLVFYLAPSDGEDREKSRAMGQLFRDIVPDLQPMGMRCDPGNPRSRIDRGINRRMLAKGIVVTSVHGGYDDESKHYIVCVHFPEWQMEGARRIQQSFGKGVT